MDFGQKVLVKAETVRVVRGWDGSFEEAGRVRDNRRRRHFGGGDVWPGEAVFPDMPKYGGYVPEPTEGSGHVRLRRIPLTEVGVIVGMVELQEGTIGSDSDIGRYWDGRNRGKYLQVAVKKDGRALLTAARPEDLQVIGE